MRALIFCAVVLIGFPSRAAAGEISSLRQKVAFAVSLGIFGDADIIGAYRLRRDLIAYASYQKNILNRHYTLTGNADPITSVEGAVDAVIDIGNPISIINEPAQPITTEPDTSVSFKITAEIGGPAIGIQGALFKPKTLFGEILFDANVTYQQTKVRACLIEQDRYVLNHRVYTRDQIGSLCADAKYGRLGGFAGFVFGNVFNNAPNIFQVTLRIGVQYQGTPSVHVSGSGSAMPAQQAKRVIEERGEDALERFKFMPYAGIGFAFGL